MRDENCIFCKIANGEIPAATIYEDELFRVILDLGPASKGHALILPKNHFADLCALDEETSSKVLALAAKIGAAMKKSLKCDGFNLVQNNGEAAGQTVFHFHMHLIPRYEGGPKMVSWEPGERTGITEKSRRSMAACFFNQCCDRADGIRSFAGVHGINIILSVGVPLFNHCSQSFICQFFFLEDFTESLLFK